jgi:integrase
MDARSGIYNGNTKGRKQTFDLFRPVSVRAKGKRAQSSNWCVRFQHQGKRTCRSLGTPDYRQAQQRAKDLVKAVRQGGWARATVLPTSHGSLPIDALLEQYHQSAVSRGLRPRSIQHAETDLRRLAKDIGARRVGNLTPEVLQNWIRDSQLKPVTLWAVLKNAGSVFSRASLQAMGLTGLQNPFARLVRPKVDREAFQSPPRAWIINLMRQGGKELRGEARLAFVLALGCGLRWGEITSLTWENVLQSGVRVLASLAKGRRQRVVPISKELSGLLKAGRCGRGGKVITEGVWEVHEKVCQWLRRKGVKDSKPVHYLRKCYGSLAVADHGIFVASKLLGHSSINLTASTYAGQVDRLPAVKF